ncbi:MAG TPA: hypothetical protein VMT57_01510 [Candidatus Thermoplasmatota archaeon]|nr:hypothetical protein [Candidatus Thermoplasmatota archaeon]
MKKMLSLMIVVMLAITGLEATALPTLTSSVTQPKHPNPLTYHEELDQSMTSFDGALPLGRTNIFGYYANLSAAQSFKPQKEVLLRAQFLMGRNATTTKPCWLAVRDNLTHTDLALVSVDPSRFPVVNGTPTNPQQLAWIDFNFTHLWATRNHTYYMVLYTANLTDNYYWISGNGSNLYLNGTVYLTINDGQTWSEFLDADACFKTYGLRETFLQITNSGPSLGASWIIKNVGNVTAWDVTASILVKGGLLGRINKTFSLLPLFQDLPPGNQTTLTMRLFGLGKITITLDVKAENVREVKITKQAFVLGFFIIVIK